ncbi:MAG: ABC transporter substrate-binding protein [Dehalococcoidia bacterium]
MVRDSTWRRAAAGRFSRRRALAAVGVSAGAMTIAAACGGDDDDGDAGGATQATAISGGAAPQGGQPKRGGTLRSAAGPLGAELDPHKTNTPFESAGIWHWAGNFLMRFNQEGLPEPDLATAQPEISDGGTTLIFKLRPEAKWQPRAPVNGRVLEAEDVAYTFERIKSEVKPSPRASFFVNVESIETPDKNTAVFKTKAPEADLLSKMSDQYQLVVPKEWKGKEKPVSSAQDVVGTGPYMADSHVLDQGFRMSRRPDGYWKENTAWLDGWDFKRVDDAQAQLAAARADQIESVGLTGDQLPEFEQDTERWYVLQSTNPTRECLLLNQERDFYKDVRVRQAVWRGIERKQIYDLVFAGLGIAGGPMTPAAAAWVLPNEELEKLPGFKKDRDAELKEAKDLLAAAGYADGFDDVMTTVTAFSTNEQADLYVPQLQRIGLRYRLENVGTDFNTFLQREINGDFSAAATLFLSGPYPDAQINQYHYTGASRNYAHFSDPKLDAMMDAQSKEFDVNKRKQLVFDLQRELINNPPGFIWVGSRGGATAYRTYYKGFWVGNFLAGYPAAENGYFDR